MRTTSTSAKHLRVLLVAFLAIVFTFMGAPAQAIVDCTQKYTYQVTTTFPTYYYVSPTGGYNYTASYAQYAGEYKVQHKVYTKHYLVQRPTYRTEYQVQYARYDTEYEVRYWQPNGSSGIEYEYRAVTGTYFDWRWHDHTIHTNYWRHKGPTSCTVAWGSRKGCGAHGKGWTGHSDTPVYKHTTTTNGQKPHPRAELLGTRKIYGSYSWSSNSTMGGVEYTGRTRQVPTGSWGGWQWQQAYAISGEYQLSGRTREVFDGWSWRKTWVKSKPWGTEGKHYRITDTRTVFKSWTSGTWTTTYPSGTANRDYRIADTKTTYVWSDPYWTSTYPHGSDYRVIDSNTYFTGWSPYYNRVNQPLPSGTHGVDFRYGTWPTPVYGPEQGPTTVYPGSPHVVTRTGSGSSTTSHGPVTKEQIPPNAHNIQKVQLPDECQQVVRPT